MQVQSNYHQLIANLSSGLGYRLQKSTPRNDSPRKSSLFVHAARCEPVSTSPITVLDDFSKYFICPYKCKETLLPPHHPSSSHWGELTNSYSICQIRPADR